MKYWLFFILWLWSGCLLAQTPVNWLQLTEVRFVQGLDLRDGEVVERPRFSKEIKKLEGKQIEISGYILPLDVTGETYVLSRYPYAACFFCGGAGLESVMDVWFAKRDKRYRLDEQVTLRGILRLSISMNGLIYLLDEAEELKQP